MKSVFRHQEMRAMLRALLAFVCLGILSTAVAGEIPCHETSHGTIAQSRDGSAPSYPIYQGGVQVELESHKHHSNVVATSSETFHSEAHSADDHENHCLQPCDDGEGCASFCVIACASSAVSAAYTSSVALSVSVSGLSLPPLKATRTFVGTVPSALYRPPINRV